MQATQLSGIEEGAGPGGIDPRPPQDLVGEEVSDSRDLGLVQQSSLEWRSAMRAPARQGVTKLPRCQAHRVGAQRGDVRIDDQTAKPTRIVEQHRPTILEVDGSTDPAILVGPGPIAQLVDPGEAIKEETTGHPEAHPEGRTLRLEEEQLALAVRGDEAQAGQDHLGIHARPTPSTGILVDEDRGDGTVQRSLRQLSVVLDLQDLGHRRPRYRSVRPGVRPR